MGTILMYLCMATIAMVTAAPVTDETGAKNFLEKYQYMGEKCPDPSMRDVSNATTVWRALLHYQTNMGINATGELDDETMEMMSKPRCGNPDVEGMQDIMRRKRFAIQGTRWPDIPLTYRFNSYTPDLETADVERIIRQAFSMWSDVANLNFVKVEPTDPAIIEIEFVSGEHGDGNNFDGPGNTLAHAYFPCTNSICGDAHFDEDEEFTDQTAQGINLLFVAVHEFGHSLGLGHSDVRDAIMFPTYLGYVPGLQLDPDDIQGITTIYGERTSITSTTTTTTTTTEPPTGPTTPTPAPPREGFCREGTVDAMGLLGDFMYAFQGSLFAALDDELGIVSGYPRLISTDFEGLSGPVDAVLSADDSSSIFVFKGSEVFRYTMTLSGFEKAQGYPRPISEQFRGLSVSDIDLAFFWSRNGHAYIFKGSDYYRLSRSFTRVDPGYPRSISVWRLPDRTYTAAFQALNRRTYFFSDDEFYRYNDTELQPDAGYPQESRQIWFLCSEATTEIDNDPDQNPSGAPSRSVNLTFCLLLVIIAVLSMLGIN